MKKSKLIFIAPLVLYLCFPKPFTEILGKTTDFVAYRIDSYFFNNKQIEKLENELKSQKLIYQNNLKKVKKELEVEKSLIEENLAIQINKYNNLRDSYQYQANGISYLSDQLNTKDEKIENAYQDYLKIKEIVQERDETIYTLEHILRNNKIAVFNASRLVEQERLKQKNENRLVITNTREGKIRDNLDTINRYNLQFSKFYYDVIVNLEECMDTGCQNYYDLMD